MSLSPTVIYEIATGEIKSSGGIDFYEGAEAAQMAAAVAPWGAETYAVAVGTGTPEGHYVAVLDGVPVVAERSPLIVEVDKTTLVADGIDSITLTGLPDPCDIIIDDPDPLVETSIETVTGGGFVFVADDAGIYIVEVRRWPFLPFKIEFTAT